jgi:hydroxymethylpyrimidine kinase/phosphomethylpyrimidine kinase
LNRIAFRARLAGGKLPGRRHCGIDRGNAASVIAAGADGIAVFSCLFGAADVEDAARGPSRGGRPGAGGTRGDAVTAIAVTVAGSDSGGGAGIQADLKTFSALGVYGASVICALTAQNTRGVQGIFDVPPAFIAAQIDSVFSDLEVAAVKIGMLSQPAVIEAVAEGLQRHGAKNIVLDPVMVATSGDRLLAPDAIETLRRVLLPLALVVTPNLPEAAALLDEPVAQDEAAMFAHAQRILAFGRGACSSRAGMRGGAEASTSWSTPQARVACRPGALPPKTPTAPAARCPRPSRRPGEGPSACTRRG